ncbi:MAG: TIGR04438 family Trp-rich protein [Betaproteobacteria bacterium]
MYFLGLGLIFLGLWWLEIGFVARWDWWWVLSPFVCAVLWWAWADWSGYSKKLEMKKMEQRKKDRIIKNREALKGGTKRSR